MSRALTWLSRGGWRMLGLNAEQLGTILLAVSITIITLMGGKKGREVAQGKPARGQDVIEVAGALVSDRAVTEWTRSADENTTALIALAKALDRNTAACGEMHEAIKDATDEMRELRREVYAQTMSRRD